MYHVKIDGNVASSHTLLIDAEEQKTRFEDAGRSNVTIEEITE